MWCEWTESRDLNCTVVHARIMRTEIPSRAQIRWSELRGLEARLWIYAASHTRGDPKYCTIREADEQKISTTGTAYKGCHRQFLSALYKMPHQPTLTELRVNNIVVCLEPAIALLNEVKDAFGTPFIQAISNITLSLLNSIKVKTRIFLRDFFPHLTCYYRM